jgi:hypothetical protein
MRGSQPYSIRAFTGAGYWPFVTLCALGFAGAGTNAEQPDGQSVPNPVHEAKQSQHGSDQPATEAAAPTPAKEPQLPLPAPRYLNLRYDEDFSYLDGEPGSYKPDFFDPIKNIHLDSDWRLTLGGEFRFQMESETNKAFGATEPANDTFQLYRFLLHADLKYEELFRVFVQGIEAFDEDRDLALRPLDENQWDLQQLFFDWRLLGEDIPWTLRLGRQELNYGNQRLVSPLDWANTRRRFDAAKLFAKYEKWDIDFFYAKPVLVQRKQGDRYDEDFDFYGIYTTYKGIARHGIDGYLFAVDNVGDVANPNGQSGDKSTYTLGSRFWGKTAGFDYEVEAAGQWGHWAGDTVCAGMVSLDGGYTFEAGGKPRLGAGFDWATGDRSPTDSKVQTFDQLFPLGHKYFGYLDLVGRQNIIGPNINFSIWPVAEKVQAAAAWHLFWLEHASDALYNASGASTRRDPSGRSGKEVGSELDLTLAWKVGIHSALLVGWSHFWDADFIQETGPSENADLFYVQYAFKF